MLNPVGLKNSFKGVVDRVRKRGLSLTIATLISLSSFAPKIHAIEMSTIQEFKAISGEASALVEGSKIINPDGSISYDISETDKDRLNKRFKDVIKKLEGEVKQDLKNQDWTHAENLISVFCEFLSAVGFGGRAEEMRDLRGKIMDDFVSHVDLKHVGAYTLKGSGKVYVISEGSSRMMGMAMDKADHNAAIYLLSALQGNNSSISAKINFFGNCIARDITGKGDVYTVYTLTVFYKGGKIILSDGTVIPEKDLAKILEGQHRLLPLK